MERQCFENPVVAAEMNKRFVNIKVDREERPDVDQLYMTAVQVLTKQGGWPMSVWLTPDLRPFYGGTYFPPEDMQWSGGGRPGFPRLLAGLEEAWRERRGEVEKTADQLLGILHQLATPRKPSEAIRFDAEKIEEFVERSAGDYEPAHGGFGRAPKFPRQTLLKFLLEYVEHAEEGSATAKRVRQMLTHTLEAMNHGGIHDHLGGGFHRYSTDAKWLVPHFEIMLYDQAMLAEVYAVGARVLGRAEFGDVARGVCEFVLREMTSPEGAFYTAMDAEVDHREGLNYLWTLAEITDVLGADDAAVFNCVYGVDQGPNFMDPHHPTASGKPEASILFMDRSIPQAAHEHGYAVPELEAKLAMMRGKLKIVRDQRKQPLLDTKVLTGWNGLMATAMVTVSRELGEKKYAAAAGRACSFLLEKQRDASGGLLRTSRDGQAKYAAFLDDYAALAEACLLAGRELEDATLVGAAGELAGEMLRKFSTVTCGTATAGGGCGNGACGGGGCGGGGLYFTADDADDLIVRQKVGTDSPLPSGNALAAMVLMELGQTERARAIIAEFAQSLDDNAEGMSALATAVQRFVRLSGVLEVAGKGGGAAREGELVAVEARWLTRNEMEIRLTIAEGYHAYPQTEEVAGKGLVGLGLEVEGGEMEFPAWGRVRMEMTGEELAAYAGEVVVRVRFAAGGVEGEAVRAVLRYQLCTQSSCLAAVRTEVEFTR